MTMCILYTNVIIYSVSDCTVCNKHKYDIYPKLPEIDIYTQYKCVTRHVTHQEALEGIDLLAEAPQPG
jgi:hypothetical protein